MREGCLSDIERMMDLLLRAKTFRIGSWHHSYLKGRAARYAQHMDRKEVLPVYQQLKMFPPVFLLW